MELWIRCGIDGWGWPNGFDFGKEG